MKPLRPHDASNPDKIAERAAKLEKVKAKVSKRVILIRHGQYELDALAPQDKILTEKGRQQAGATGKRLKVVDGCICSMKRGRHHFSWTHLP